MDRLHQIARITHELHEARAFLAAAADLADEENPPEPDQIRAMDYNSNLAAAEGRIETAAAYLADIRIYQPQ